MTIALPYAFGLLNDLLADVEPCPDRKPIDVALGEPRLSPPSWIGEFLSASGDDWRRYPPVAGGDSYRQAAADWLVRRFGLADGMIDPGSMILSASGTREALFQAAGLAVDMWSGTGRPAIAFPDPFYGVYYGAALGAGAEAVPLPPGPSGLPDPDAVAANPDLLSRLAMVTLCHPSNPQGTVVSASELKRWLILARAHGCSF